MLGDSISAGYGINVEAGWVALLQQRLVAQGYGYTVINASVSGETTTGGLARLPRALRIHQPAIIIVELGANDGLRGVPLQITRQNLQRMLDLAIAAHGRPILLGMRIPPNYGERYASGFAQIFSELSRLRSTPLVPFLLDKVALDPRLMQADGLHPNIHGQPLLLDNVWPVLVRTLENKRTRRAE